MVVQMEAEVREYAELANVLWHEREAMSHVLFKLTQERLIVAAGETRWLADANRELEAALERLRTTEVLRAIESDALAERIGLPGGTTLSQLAEQSQQPWSTILLEHRQALLTLSDELSTAVGAAVADMTSRAPTADLVSRASLQTTANIHQTSLLDYLSNSSPSS